MTVADATDLWPIYADPEMWWYEPSHRHADPEKTRSYADRAAARWALDGLSYWTVRLAATGEVIGSGGAQRHPPGHWNLNYRIARAHQGHGHAGRLLTAALAAAAAVDPGAPCIAWIDEVNAPSRRVAERGGLVDHGLRAGAVDGVVRLAYADRSLDDRAYPPAGPDD